MAIIEADAAGIARAADLLRAGELVALPTETVYGLGADAVNEAAVARIFSAKGRPADHPLIVHLARAEELTTWARSVPREAIALARAFWPGPLTLILPRSDEVPDRVTGGQDTVGLRVPGHPVALALLEAFGGGIAAPSANRFGRISPTTASHVEAELGERVPLILDGGPCQVGIESTILDLSGAQPVILRPGAISAAAIAQVIGRPPLDRRQLAAADDTVRAPGGLPAHYAPGTAMRLLSHASLLAEAAAYPQRRLAVLSREAMAENFQGIWKRAPHTPDAYARALYADLRALDAAGCDLILVEAPPETAPWQAIRDRLQRAAQGAGEHDET